MTYKDWYGKNKSYALNFRRIDRFLRRDHYKKLDRDHHLRHKTERNEYSLGYYYLNRERILAKMAENYQKKKLSK